MIQELAGATGIVVDLAKVSFFDTSGVRMLDRMAGRCDGAGIGFRVAAPPDVAARLVLRLAVFREDLVSANVDEARGGAGGRLVLAPRAAGPDSGPARRLAGHRARLARWTALGGGGVVALDDRVRAERERADGRGGGHRLHDLVVNMGLRRPFSGWFEG